MSEFLFGLAELSVTMGTVIALLLALEPVLQRRFRPQWRYWAWLLVALRLAVPFNGSVPAPPVVLEAPSLAVPAVERLAPAPAEYPSEGAAPEADAPQPVGNPSTPEKVSGGTELQARSAGGPETALMPPAVPSVTLAAVLLGLWGTGALLFLVAHIGGYLRFLRRVKRWRSPAGCYEGLPVYRCAAVSSPVLAGLVRPRVYVPEELCGEPYEFAMLHEHTHFLRRDLWYKALLVWVNALFWFHPLVWLLRRSAERDVEIACDAQVLRGKDFAYRQRYGAALLSFAAGPHVPLTSGFSGGMRGLRLRFRALVDTAPKGAGRAALALVLCAAALGAGLVACRTAEEVLPHDGVYYSRDPALEGDVLTFTPLTESGTADAALSFPLAEYVHLPVSYQLRDMRRSRNEEVAELLTELNEDFSYSFIDDAEVYHYHASGTEALTVTVKGGQVTALKWVEDPHLDAGDGIYYTICQKNPLSAEDGILTFTSIPLIAPRLDGGVCSISMAEDEWRQMSFPLVDVVTSSSEGELDPSDSKDLDTLLNSPESWRYLTVDLDGPFPLRNLGQTQVTCLIVQDGKVTNVDWFYAVVEPEPLEDGTYYGTFSWRGMPEEEPVPGLYVYLSKELPEKWEDWGLFAFQYLPIAPVRQEGALERLCELLRAWGPKDEVRLMEFTVKNGEAVEMVWTDYVYEDTPLATNAFSLSGGQYDWDWVIRRIDLEQGTVTFTWDTQTVGESSTWETYKLAPGTGAQLWDTAGEGWVDATVEDLAQTLNLMSTWGMPCKVRMAGNWVAAIREDSPWGDPVLPDGTYHIGRIRWGDVHWDTPEKPIGAVEATVYSLDPETGHVADSLQDVQLMVSKSVACCNGDGTAWEGDLESFLKAYAQDAQALRRERKLYLTWPLNNILTLEVTVESGLIRAVRRMPPPEL